MEKVKLTAIKEIKFLKKRVKNENGAIEIVETPVSAYKPVNYIEGMARLGAHLLDLVFIYIFLIMFETFIYLILRISLDDELPYTRNYALWMLYIRVLIILPGYYILFESTAQATPAKLILGRVVVDEYGEKPRFMQIVGRSYARLVPFESFSCLNTLGWHDIWSETLVLRKRDLEDLKLAKKLMQFDAQPNDNGGRVKNNEQQNANS